MPVPDFPQHIEISYLDHINRAHLKMQPQTGGAGSLSFDDLVDVVNPLQHLPIVGTLYRKYANDPINPLPKIAGDTLYGGSVGLVSSLADYAFEKITGKNFGDTVLAWVTGDDGTPKTAVASSASLTASPASPTAPPQAGARIASTLPTQLPSALSGAGIRQPARPTGGLTFAQSGNAPAAPAPGTAQIPTISQAALDALMAAVNHNNPDSDTNSRMIDAYRKTMQLGSELPPGPVAIH